VILVIFPQSPEACPDILRPPNLVQGTFSTKYGAGNPAKLSSLLSSCSRLSICRPRSSSLGTPTRVILGWRVGTKGVRKIQVRDLASNGQRSNTGQPGPRAADASAVQLCLTPGPTGPLPPSASACPCRPAWRTAPLSPDGLCRETTPSTRPESSGKKLSFSHRNFAPIAPSREPVIVGRPGLPPLSASACQASQPAQTICAATPDGPAHWQRSTPCEEKVYISSTIIFL